MLDDQLAPPPPGALIRRLGVPGVLFLTLSVTTPASSVWVIIPGMFQVAGTGAVWAMVLAGLVCVATAYVYAELSSAFPVAGGEYVVVAQTLGPCAGFIMLGVNVFNNLLFPAVAGLGVSAVLGMVWPGLPAVAVAVAVVLASTLIAVLNIRINALVTGLFLLLELVALAIVAWLGLSVGGLDPVAWLSHPVMPSTAGLVPADASAIGVAATIGLFALNGYGAAVYFSEEMHEAPRRIGGTVMIALVVALAAELVPMLAALAGAPDMSALLASDDPFGLLVAARGGAGLAGWLSVAVVIAILNAAIACTLATARFFYGTARDRSWGRPIDAVLGALHPRWNSPALGTLLVGAVGVGCCFLPLPLLLVLSGAGLVAIYAGLCLAAIVGRRTGATAAAAFRMPLYPLAPALTLAALVYVVWTSWWDLEEGRPGLIATLAQIGVSAAYYALVLRRRGWRPVLPDQAGANAPSASIT